MKVEQIEHGGEDGCVVDAGRDVTRKPRERQHLGGVTASEQLDRSQQEELGEAIQQDVRSLFMFAQRSPHRPERLGGGESQRLL